MGTLEGLGRAVGNVRLRSTNGVPVLEETYAFTVIAAAANESYASLLNTPGLPIVGQTVSTLGLTVCNSLNGTRNPSNAFLWEFIGEFSSEVEDRQGAQNAAGDPASFDPETWVPVRETKSERITEVSLVDASGNAIANSAGQLFPSGITRTRRLPVWEFFQFESGSVTDETVWERSEVVNNATFKTKPEKTLLCVVLSSVVGFYYGQPRRLTQYQVTYNRKKWTDRRLDVGQVFLETGALKPYTDSEGNVILGGLNGSGAKVAAGTAPAIREFDQFPAVSFADFLRV